MPLYKNVSPDLKILYDEMKANPLFAYSLMFPDMVKNKFADWMYEHDELIRGNGELFCFIEHRGAAKTSRYTIAATAYNMLFEDHHYALLCGNSEKGSVKRFMKPLKVFFEKSPIVKALWGNIVGDIWGASDLELYFRNDDGEVVDSKKIESYGVGQSIRGLCYLSHRPDWVVADDIEQDDKIDNPTRREQIQNWFWAQVYGALDKEGDIYTADKTFAVTPKFLAGGTFLHEESFLNMIYKGSEQYIIDGNMPEGMDVGNYNGFVVRVVPVTKMVDGVEVSTWPERYSVEYWNNVKKLFVANGRLRNFLMEYMNIIRSKESQIIPIEKVKMYEDKDLRDKNLLKVTFIDLAVTDFKDKRAKKRDATAIMTLASERGTGNVYVLDYENFQTDQVTYSIKTTVAQAQEYMSSKIGYERSGQQQILESMLKAECNTASFFARIIGVTPGNVSKIDRVVITVANLAHQGKLFVKKEHQELLTQMASFPSGKRDLVDGLAYCISISDPQFTGYAEEKKKAYTFNPLAMSRANDADNPNRIKRSNSPYKYFDY